VAAVVEVGACCKGSLSMADEDTKGRGLPSHLLPLFKEKLSDRAARAIESVLEHGSEKLTTGRISRAFSVSKLAVSTGSRFLYTRAKDALAGGDEDEKKVMRGMDIAADMLKTFSELRGVAMKVGQMLSYVDDALPPEARKVLALLQRDVPPMPWSDARAQVIAELGRPPEEIFRSIEEAPLAAASIGQVHRAVLKNGTPVAVKVQYPGIDRAMAGDLQSARIASIFQRMFFFRTDTTAIMQELEERFMDECDYRKEADYQEAYRQRLDGHRWIIVPEVHREYSGQRVLTTTLMEGMTFYEWLALNPSTAEREHATRLFYRFYIGSFYLDGLFNCDPHPGNYLFQADGKIVFLDYGCSRRFPDHRRRLWIAFCQAVSRDLEPEIQRLAIELGFFKDGHDYDREAFRELMRYLYQPYLYDEPFDFKLHRPESTFKRMFTENPNLFKLNMPADAVFLNRIGFGLVSLMSEIGSSLNCRRQADAYFAGVDPDWPDDPRRAGAPLGMTEARPSLEGG
jgi:predicted unusual protein kinase regulating ubiquinone biosynthesis (AarF/ABC1/UbiB family)